MVAALAVLGTVTLSHPAPAAARESDVCVMVCLVLTAGKGYTGEAAAAYFGGCLVGCW